MKKTILAIFLFLFIGFNAFARLNVSSSIFIVSSLIKQIGGDRVNVSYVIPSSSNPHVFSPKPKELINFEKADLFVGVGFGFESWYDRVAFLRDNKRNIFLSDIYKSPLNAKRIGNKIIANPHIWLDVNFMKELGIPYIVQNMCNLDEKNCGFYRANARSLEESLSGFSRGFSRFKNICIVDVKPAFEYLLKSLGLKSCSVVIEKGNQSPTVGDLKRVFKHCRCKKGVVIYVSDKHLAEVLAKRLNYKPVCLNPLGSPDDDKTNSYVKLLSYDIGLLRESLIR
ncbi:metal ABC transporter substrate-binding protein [Hippea maritima]|uniref:ABC-type metal ion transporter, periplasmic subunit n=1 Tax=Hippea maritima (strain ATCC 700847 / DSM 10411 / MH2) TaxID=760142 RepID=F2LW72_HIPMA|nr:metal ABC transporter substrate-binding protein [Hippea maritima]AEA34006.1 ABC-type metal ion transporter, periplasmic subunit [Hippea maritima DSM 10411]